MIFTSVGINFGISINQTAIWCRVSRHFSRKKFEFIEMNRPREPYVASVNIINY